MARLFIPLRVDTEVGTDAKQVKKQKDHHLKIFKYTLATSFWLHITGNTHDRKSFWALKVAMFKKAHGFHQKYLNFQKMNEGLTGLGRHDSE